MKVIGQADLDINESDWASGFWIQMKVIGRSWIQMQVIGQAVQDLNESDWGSGSGYK